MEKMQKATIRQLAPADWALWREIRLEAIQRHPEAFGGSYEDEALYTEATLKETLVNKTVFGAFIDNDLVGISGFLILASRKTQHRGNLFSVYVKGQYRGQGIADQLTEAVIQHARTKVLQLHCSVVTSNTSAIALYQRHGLTIYGTEPRSLKVDDRYYDEHLMVLRFDERPI